MTPFLKKLVKNLIWTVFIILKDENLKYNSELEILTLCLKQNVVV